MNKTLAKFFYEQCTGTTNGHMAAIPNNPVLYALVQAHCGQSMQSNNAAKVDDFAKMLRDIADALECV